ncbi:uncharacterized protein LOC108095638 [Drosophila ficusphila]|uniref:uncharacterized protein LOC108095638 n=1 Tax=Drosophila ficusphila TaxID=30025 RepID=UPI0007E64573|nr:uncharacterized protein LOC108095638 [Drosophila ficusphila]
MATTQEIMDGLLIYMVASKLDRHTREKWEEGLSANKLLKWKDMATLLEKKCRMLEDIKNAMVIQTPSKQVPQYSPKSSTHCFVFVFSKLHYAGTSAKCIDVSVSLTLITICSLSYGVTTQINKSRLISSIRLPTALSRLHFWQFVLCSSYPMIPEEATQIREQVKELLSKGNFPIRKWCSNEAEALKGEPEVDREKKLRIHDGTDVLKTLGLYWDAKSDHLLFSLSGTMSESGSTKRSILSAVAKFYDPLGLIAPIVTKFKIFLQILWKDKLAKYHFHRLVGRSLLTFHKLRTLVCEVSAMLNSRPLCPISENPSDLEVLTPGHFLIGTAFNAIDEPDITHLEFARCSRRFGTSGAPPTYRYSRNVGNGGQKRQIWRPAA